MVYVRWQIGLFRKGATLIEALALLFIFGVITVAFYNAWSGGTRMIIETRNRLGAVSMASQRMEIIRNLDYASLGTKVSDGSGGYEYGIPGGDILEDETIVASNQTYRIHTTVQYVDDAFDGKSSGTTPIDIIPSDYKKVTVRVEWGVGGDGQRVNLSSIFSPRGVEQSAGGGVLSLNVLDTAGVGIGNADVHITNTALTPHINVTAQTDSTGNLTFVGAPAASQSYVIAVSKSGYLPITTYASSATLVPLEANASVVVATLNQKTLVTDRVADLRIQTRDPFGERVASRVFRLVGGKQLGTNPNPPPTPVYVVDQEVNTGTEGEFELEHTSAGSYTLTPTNDAQFVFLRLSVEESEPDRILLSPGVDSDVTMTYIPTALSSLLVKVQTTAVPPGVIGGASVRVTSAGGYDATVVADRYGQAYFPVTSGALPVGNYTVAVEASGYQTTTETVALTGNLATKEIALPVQ